VSSLKIRAIVSYHKQIGKRIETQSGIIIPMCWQRELSEWCKCRLAQQSSHKLIKMEKNKYLNLFRYLNLWFLHDQLAAHYRET
jgi:hypothetical protein